MILISWFGGFELVFFLVGSTGAGWVRGRGKRWEREREREREGRGFVYCGCG
jgi:hypothetical protein